MRIFNKDKTQELNSMDIDLSKGELKSDKLEKQVPEQLAVAEQSHYEQVKDEPKGVVRKVVDVKAKPYVPAHIEYEDIQVFVPYTETEIAIKKLEDRQNEIKAELSSTDVKRQKMSEEAIKEFLTSSNNDTKSKKECLEEFDKADKLRAEYNQNEVKIAELKGSLKK